MGLDTSYNCWSGSYGKFMRWRAEVCLTAGYGNIYGRIGFGGNAEWPNSLLDPLLILLSHSDCDGIIEVKHCKNIANRLRELLAMNFDESFTKLTTQFIEGLELAAKENTDVEFY